MKVLIQFNFNDLIAVSERFLVWSLVSPMWSCRNFDSPCQIIQATINLKLFSINCIINKQKYILYLYHYYISSLCLVIFLQYAHPTRASSVYQIFQTKHSVCAEMSHGSITRNQDFSLFSDTQSFPGEKLKTNHSLLIQPPFTQKEKQ